MLRPVSPDSFYDSEVGIKYLDQFTSRVDTRDEVFFEWANVPTGEYLPDGEPDFISQRVPVPAEIVEQRLEKIAHWLTANYDPSTDRCTLYRATDDQRIDDAVEYGAITSRLVEAFGGDDWDIELARDSLILASEGKVPNHVIPHILGVFNAADNDISALSNDNIMGKWRSRVQIERLTAERDEAEQFSYGITSDRFGYTLQRKANQLTSAMALGKTAYLTAVEAANGDVIPTPASSLYNLTHSSIHLTTDIDFIKLLSERHGYQYLEISFKPGQLPVGPSLGYVDRSFVVHETSSGSYNSSGAGEYEWYGIGQLMAAGVSDVELTVKSVSDL